MNDHYKEIISDANQSFYNNKWEEAAEKFEEIIKLDPEGLHKIYLDLGMCYWKLDQPKKCIRSLKNSINLNKSHPNWVFRLLGESYLKIEDYENSTKYFKKFSNRLVKNAQTNRDDSRNLYEARISKQLDELHDAVMDYWGRFDRRPIFLSGEPSPLVSQDLLSDCKLLTNRDKMIEYLPRNAKVAEVGTQKGVFAKHILNRSDPSELHLFDIDFSLFVFEDMQPYIDSGKVKLHEGDSSSLLAEFPDNYFDWIYIDGDHSYQGVVKDINEAHKKVKNDGWLVFNDYTCWSPLEVESYGVYKAINEFANDKKWKFEFLALHELGYHDVALRKVVG